MAASSRQRPLLPPQAHSTAGHPSRRAQRALEEQGKPGHTAAQRASPPPARGRRGPSSQRPERGTEKMAAALSGRRGGPQHSRPAPRAAPPHQGRNGSDVRRDPRPCPAPRGRGGGRCLQGTRAPGVCSRLPSRPPASRPPAAGGQRGAARRGALAGHAWGWWNGAARSPGRGVAAVGAGVRLPSAEGLREGGLND